MTTKFKIFFIAFALIIVSSSFNQQGFSSKGNNESLSKVRREFQFKSTIDHTWKAALGGIRISEKFELSLRNPYWLQIWRKLPSFIQDRILSEISPVFAKQNRSKLHCLNAYTLCREDNNCRAKYWNFLSSCSQAAQPISFQEFIDTSQWENDLYFSSIKRKRAARSTPSHLRRQSLRENRFQRRFRKSKRLKKRRRKQFKKRKKRHRNFARSFKKSKELWKKTIDELHHWMGRYWLSIYEKNDQDSALCSTECLNALVLLNKTVYGSLLANCDCGRENFPSYNTSIKKALWNPTACKKHQATALSCRPRLYKQSKAEIGCSLWRVKCENSPRCRKAQKNFFRFCSQTINGIFCTQSCRNAIKKLKRVQKNYNSCVCDGSDKHFCLKIKENIKNLCFPNKECEKHSGKLGVSTNQNCDKTVTVLRVKKSISEAHNSANQQKTMSFSSKYYLAIYFFLLLFFKISIQ